MSVEKHVLITGGAGYIGSLLTGALLRQGYCVTVVDELLFGGDSLSAYLPHPNFRFIKSNVWEARAIRDAVKGEWPVPEAIVHLAGHCRVPSLPGGRPSGGLALQRGSHPTRFRAGR